MGLKFYPFIILSKKETSHDYLISWHFNNNWYLSFFPLFPDEQIEFPHKSTQTGPALSMRGRRRFPIISAWKLATDWWVWPGKKMTTEHTGKSSVNYFHLNNMFLVTLLNFIE